jgi:Domain of unknown function (DUF6457)
MDAWLTEAADRLARVTGVPRGDLELDDATVTRLLELARSAAHESGARTNAPLLCYLAGICVGRGAELAGIDE